MYKGVNEFKKGYQPRAIVIKKDDSRIVAGTNSILSRCKLYYSNLLNVYRSSDLEGREINRQSKKFQSLDF
jgi:hypothetical protein